MNWRNKTLKYLTVLIAITLILSPETAQLGLFIDAAGLDLLILLLEIQLLTIGTSVYQWLIQWLGVFLKHPLPDSQIRPREWFNYITSSLTLSVPAEATFMHLLVGGVIINMTYPVLIGRQLFAI